MQQQDLEYHFELTSVVVRSICSLSFSISLAPHIAMLQHIPKLMEYESGYATIAFAFGMFGPVGLVNVRAVFISFEYVLLYIPNTHLSVPNVLGLRPFLIKMFLSPHRYYMEYGKYEICVHGIVNR